MNQNKLIALGILHIFVLILLGSIGFYMSLDLLFRDKFSASMVLVGSTIFLGLTWMTFSKCSLSILHGEEEE